MEEEDSFVPNLAAMLEVSLVEDMSSTVTFSATGEHTGKGDRTEQTDINNANGVAPSDPELPSKAKSIDVLCSNSGKQDEVQGAAHPDSESPSKSVSKYVSCPPENALDTDLLEFGHQELMISESQSETVIEEEEKEMYNSVFKDLRKVMYLRLHCTVCDCHIGCTPEATFNMSFHKVLRVLICKDCETFYGNGDFPCGDDGSETFCRWCGQGGQLYCCSVCPNVFCKKCVRRNLGKKTVQLIEESSDWTCFRCDLKRLWEHRALCWGLSTFLREQSKAENKVPADVAEKSPGFNPSLCCKGEKHAYFRAGQPLKHLLVPTFARGTLKVKDIQTLKSPSNEMNILRNTLTSDGKALHIRPSTINKPSSNTDTCKVEPCIPVSNIFSSSQPHTFVTSRSNEDKFLEQVMPANKSSGGPNLGNVPESPVRTFGPTKQSVQGDGVTKSTLHFFQKQPHLTYESAFLSHLARTSIQNHAEGSRQNSAVTVTGHVTDSNPSANLIASVPVTYVQGPLRTVIMSPRSNPVAGPTVSKVFINQSNSSSNPTYTVPTSIMSPTKRIQCSAVTTLPNTYYIISSGPSKLPKLVPISSVHNPPFPSPGHTQLTHPPCPNTILQKNVENVVSGNKIQTKDTNPSVDDDNDIIEVFSSIQNSSDPLKIEYEWMLKTLKKTNHASRILAYHVEVLRQKLVSEVGKEANTKSISHLAGKFHHLLVKACKRLNIQKEFLSKEFSDWLNTERANHGIPVTKERRTNSSPPKCKASDAETTHEPELLLDMDISCESDYEDVPTFSSVAKQDLMECNENLSDYDSDSDPFSDSEGTEQKEMNPELKSFFSCTVRELLRDKFSSKLVLQLLMEHHLKTSNVENKRVSSTKGLQFVDATTQAGANTEEEIVVEGKESRTSKLKSLWSGAFTDFLTQRMSEENSGILSSDLSNLSPHSVEIATGSGTDIEKCMKTESIDPNSKGVQNSELESLCNTTEDRTGNRESERCPTPCEDNNIDSSEAEAKDSSIHMNRDTMPIQNETASKSSSHFLAAKRKYQCTESCSNVSSDRQTNHSKSSHGSSQIVVKKVRAASPNSHSSSSSLMVSVIKLERIEVDNQIPVTDYTALINSAVQKKLIKPCSVSVMKLNRTH